MKRTLLFAALAGALPGLMYGNGMIAATCGGTVGAPALTDSTVCAISSSTYGTVLESFSNSLQWNNGPTVASGTLTATDDGAPASADGYQYNTTWTGNGGTISASGSALELADNYIDTYDPRFGWGVAGPGTPQTWEGTFDSQPDAGAGNYGDYLLGSASGAITIADQSSGFSNFGFRIESATQTSFDVVINLYNSSHSLVGTLQTNTLTGGGTCTSLAANGTNPPAPCNSAPFIQVTTEGGVYSFSVYTTNSSGGQDTGGFFLDTFHYSGIESVPEPASLLLAGAGLASLLAFARRRNRGQALGNVGTETVDKA